jgi:hypothetical protein
MKTRRTKNALLLSMKQNTPKNLSHESSVADLKASLNNCVALRILPVVAWRLLCSLLPLLT